MPHNFSESSNISNLVLDSTEVPENQPNKQTWTPHFIISPLFKVFKPSHNCLELSDNENILMS